MAEDTKDTTTSGEQAETHPSEDDVDVYPLRDPSEDPGWAVKTVWTWVVIAISLLLFFLVLLILGLWYD